MIVVHLYCSILYSQMSPMREGRKHGPYSFGKEEGWSEELLEQDDQYLEEYESEKNVDPSFPSQVSVGDWKLSQYRRPTTRFYVKDIPWTCEKICTYSQSIPTWEDKGRQLTCHKEHPKCCRSEEILFRQ